MHVNFCHQDAKNFGWLTLLAVVLSSLCMLVGVDVSSPQSFISYRLYVSRKK